MVWHIAWIHLLGLMSPGPDFFYITRTAARFGRRQAVAAVCGIVVGVMAWAVATILGLVLLFRAFPAVEAVLVCAGGVYLMYLGWKMLGVRAHTIFPEDGRYGAEQETAVDWCGEVKKGLLVNLSNPKVVVYFSSVMSVVLAEVAAWWQIVAVLLLIFVETLLYFMMVAVLFSGGAVKRFYSCYGRYLDNAAGVLFLGFGAYLLAGIWLK
ncbi:hypothetical protein D0T90_00875 [Neisseria animalis]|uniref:Threonine efflux protein n=2 Tax=Neisseria animalis TaxID=492 RepID=A0A5P3MTT3_NEIAN|nr:hypothetical protein D0T90_00875 [Neisseria animalis]ROW32017.1 hypothetical protein CGZ60_07540 [Neisseria animalis]VEE08471.1 Threonine efflux protein [Neisseria animalis]